MRSHEADATGNWRLICETAEQNELSLCTCNVSAGICRNMIYEGKAHHCALVDLPHNQLVDGDLAPSAHVLPILDLLIFRCSSTAEGGPLDRRLARSSGRRAHPEQ